MIKKIEKTFYGIWCKFNNQNLMSTITLDEIQTCCEEKGLEVISIQETSFGFNATVPAIKVNTLNGIAIFPRQKLSEIEIYNKNIIPFQNAEEFWHKVDWFPPLFMSMSDISRGLDVVSLKIGDHTKYTREKLQERFEQFFPTVYNFSNIIPITIQTLPNSIAIAKHTPVIKESILAFYSGMRVTAIASLIPIIEDILNTILGIKSTDIDLISKVNHCIDLANKKITAIHVDHADWIPPEYIDLKVLKVMNERIRITELIRDWLTTSFYRNTDEYNNRSGFNRHFFAHAKSEIWQNQSNFFRAIGLIQALAFIECFAMEETKLSIFPPDPDERSISFRLDIFACMNIQAIKNQVLTLLQIDNNLPFNPTASDDGWLNRAAILSEKMDNQIIKKLRDKGWQCYSFGEPIEDGNYITVNASKGNRTIKIALLYSCATANNIYKELDKTCDYILYQGAYYHQDSFAYGIKNYVGPLNAWLTPE